MTRQQTFPFTRDEQAAAVAAALERLRPALSTCRLRGLRGLLDAVLTAPRTERGELPLESLAARLDRSTRSAWSLLKAAEALGLVVVERADGMRRPHCVRLDFDGLRLVGREGAKPSATVGNVPNYSESSNSSPTVEAVELIAEPVAAAASSPSPSSPACAHVMKNFPNVRKNFPNGEQSADNVGFIYLPPYPPKPTGDEQKTTGGGAGLANARGPEAADVRPVLQNAFGDAVRSGEPSRTAKRNEAERSGTRPETLTRIDFTAKRNASGTQAETGEAWAEAAAALGAAGLGAVGPAIEQARARGLTPAAVAAACATFVANRAKFKSAGALRFWLANGAWPTDAAVVDPADQARRRDEAEARQARDRQAHVAAVERIAAETDAAEAEHGAALDALGETERDAMAADVLRVPGLLDGYRRGRWREPGSLVRDCLLNALGARSVSA